MLDSRRALLALGLALVSFGLPAPGTARDSAAADQATDSPVVRVGIIYDGPGPDLPGPRLSVELVEKIVEETANLTRRDFDVRFPEDQRLTGDWSIEGIREAIDRQLADPAVDIVVAVGPYTTNVISRKERLDKPVLALFAIDPEAQSLPSVTDAKQRRVSGVHNLSYITTSASVVRDLRAFKEIVDFSKLHVLADTMLPEAVPQVLEFAGRISSELGFEVALVGAADSADEALAQLPPDAEAVYLTPLSRMPEEQLDRLAAGLIERRLPSFSLIGREDVARGILAGLRPATNYDRLARRVALNLQRILRGEDAGALPVILEQKDSLVVNMDTVQAISLPLAWRVVLKADLIREEQYDPDLALTLDEAVQEAIRANLGLRARREEVAAAAESIAQAKSLYRPFVDLSVGGLRLDVDTARDAQGSAPQGRLDASVGLTQLIYSDAALANIKISKDLQTSRELDWDALRLDLALDASIAFLNVLRTETLERIELENLQLTESNLELARTRQEVGYSGPADVFRWESQLAAARAEMIAAVQSTRAARYNLAALLNRPQTDPLWTESPQLTDPRLISGFARLRPYLENVLGGELFLEFLVEEGLRNAPELSSIEAAIAAQQRASLAARRAYWAPEIGLSADFSSELDRWGEGVTGVIAPSSDSAWSLAVLATLPLYAGGERASLLREANKGLEQLRIDRAALAQRIELRIRVDYARVCTSYPAIELAKEAARASAKNLELVTDSYSRGLVSVIDLLDAQNAALVSEQAAANSEYDFLIDLISLQRATNNIAFLMSQDERDAWFDRLQQFFEEHGSPVRGTQ